MASPTSSPEFKELLRVVARRVRQEKPPYDDWYIEYPNRNEIMLPDGRALYCGLEIEGGSSFADGRVKQLVGDQHNIGHVNFECDGELNIHYLTNEGAVLKLAGGVVSLLDTEGIAKLTTTIS